MRRSIFGIPHINTPKEKTPLDRIIIRYFFWGESVFVCYFVTFYFEIISN